MHFGTGPTELEELEELEDLEGVGDGVGHELGALVGEDAAGGGGDGGDGGGGRRLDGPVVAVVKVEKEVVLVDEVLRSRSQAHFAGSERSWAGLGLEEEGGQLRR